MADGRGIISFLAASQDLQEFRKRNWEGSFEAYLDLARERHEGNRIIEFK